MCLRIPFKQIYKLWELFLNPDTLSVLAVYYYTFTIISGYDVIKLAIL